MTRPVLHPATPALLLVVLGAAGAVLAAHDVGAALLLLTATAGAGAGFANSGST